MHDFDRCKRCMKLAQSFFGVEFEKFVALSNDPTQEKEVEAANKNLKLIEGGSQASFKTPMSVDTNKVTGYKMKQSYSFLTVSQFTQKFTHHPKNLGLKIMSLEGEDGTSMIKGVAIQYDPTLPFRKVTFYNLTSWQMSEYLMKSQDRLREKQPVQTYHKLCDMKSKEHPMALAWDFRSSEAHRYRPF